MVPRVGNKTLRPGHQGLPLALHELAEEAVLTDPLVALPFLNQKIGLQGVGPKAQTGA